MNPTTTESLLRPRDALAILTRELTRAIAARYGITEATVAFEAPRRPEFGDFATNVAFGLAKTAKTAPQHIATALIEELRATMPPAELELFPEMTAVAGFINVKLAPVCWHAQIAQILRDGEAFGRAPKRATRISLEFGSANPTGPLVVVQGRTMSIGQTLANALRFCGYDVFTEWIINDYGGQMETLARSIYARYRQLWDPAFPFPEEGYPADYVIEIAQALRDIDGDRWTGAPPESWLEYFARFGADRMVAQQQEDAATFGIQYNLWQSERELHESGRVLEDLRRLTAAGHTYEQDGALFFRATEFGDDKDRVLVRSDGRPTYYGADIAYHYEKLSRSDRVIDILGPDHHGYIGRIKGVAAALGFPGQLEVLISQQITLMRGDEQVSMSKRSGNIVTLSDIIDEVGIDAARFFFVMLAVDSPLKFDLALAKEASNNNPVFYVQYGHARIASVFNNALPAEVTEANTGAALQALTHPAELALARRLSEFPEIVQSVAEYLAPHRFTHYAREVASDFHQFYGECKILTEDREVRLARLSLCIAARTVLATTLKLIGVSAPDSM